MIYRTSFYNTVKYKGGADVLENSRAHTYVQAHTFMHDEGAKKSVSCLD